MSKKIFKLSLILIISSLLLSACTLPWKKKVVSDPNLINSENNLSEDTGSTNSEKTNKIKKFSNYDSLKTFLKENEVSRANVYYDSFNLSSGLSSGAELTNSLKSTDAVSPNTTNDVMDYSGTNNQVLGVDEADIIKTDGNYIYALVRNELKIIKSEPAKEARVISTITLPSRPQGMFINGSSLSVFGSDRQVYTLDIYRNSRRQGAYTFFKTFDLTDIINPKQVRDLSFEGSYSDARLIGDYVYLFTDSQAVYSESESVAPRVIENGEDLVKNCLTPGLKCFAPDIYYFDIPYDSYQFVNVTAINTKDNTEALGGQSYLMNSGQNFYVSENNIFITYTEYLNEYELEQEVERELIFSKLSSEDQEKIKKIEAADSFILSKSEKIVKVSAIISNYISGLNSEDRKNIQTEIDNNLKTKLLARANDLEKTIIHKIAINGRNVEYRAMGEVKGQVLNQFSMDESGDYFRIATTRNEIWSNVTNKTEESYSNVYVLNNELKLLGSLENLATTEKIYSARFMGDRVYLVTFKKTDPLYAISLSDPTKPSVLGAIKIPGFSSYLHPADKDGNKIIGFGRDAEEDSDGRVKIKGLKMALFDFTDLNNPKELDSYIIGDSSSDSIALYDHKAFLYSEAKNLLSIPAVLRNDGGISFSGALIFNITDNRFVLKGRIDHAGGASRSTSDYWDGYGYYDNTVKRSLYINDNIFTFSNRFLKVNNLNDLSSVNDIILSIDKEANNSVSSNSVSSPAAPTTPPASQVTPDTIPVNDAAITDNPEGSAPLNP